MLAVERRAPLILVVEDDRASAKHIAEMLNELGYQTRIANAWTSALRILAEEDIDLVLMDAVMPTVDGFKLTRILRERSESYVPIVFLTGLQDTESRERGIEAGADDLLTKPVDRLELRLRLHAMLRIRRLTRALEKKTSDLERLARQDPLTGLGNRLALGERLAGELARARRYGRALALLMVDVDHFKKLNDAYGHEAGDLVLAALGQMLREELRESDGAFRYGGEEFVVVAPESDLEAGRLLGERLRRCYARERKKVSVAGGDTVSIGVACTETFDPEITADALLRAADAALYAAKREGRDQVRVRRDRLDSLTPLHANTDS